MSLPRRALAVLLVLCVGGLFPLSVEAGFRLLEDFEGLAPGSIDEQGDWTAAASTTAVVPDPAAVNGDNQVLSVTTNSTHAYRDAQLLNGAVRMVFLRFRFGGQQNYSFGFSDSSAPDQFGDFEVELGMSNASNDLRVNDGGNYDVIGLLEPDRWYNAWIYVDNITDDYRVYLNATPGADAAPQDLLASGGQTVFEFRDGTAGNLRSFFIKTGGGSSGNSGPLYIDDIYIEDNWFLNLRNPTVPLPCEAVRVDFDSDCDVDADDFDMFQQCASAPAVPVGANCPAFDLDTDGDVDQDDFGLFQRCVSGAGVTADPTCIDSTEVSSLFR